MKKILVVDDDKDMLDLIEYILASRGFDVYTHSTGLHVPEIVKGYSPHIILLDVQLAEIIGTDICNELKKSFNIPIIIMSGHRFTSSHQCNADAYISKPFNMLGLLDAIQFHINDSTKKSN